MKLTRHLIVQDAKVEFLRFWVDFVDKHGDLTHAEVLNILHEQQQSLINGMLRAEWEADSD